MTPPIQSLRATLLALGLISTTALPWLAPATLEPAPAHDDWPQWRGPAFDGSGENTGLPASWSLDDGVVWRTDLAGPSAATPVVAEGRVYLTAFEPESEALLAVAVDRATGELLWERECGVGRRPSGRSRGRENSLGSGSPVTDGELVCFLFGTGDLWAFDAEGEELWHRDLAEEYGEIVIQWGYAASPLLFDGRLFVAVMHRGDSYVLAVDPRTGENLWKVARPSDANFESKEAYTTPIPFENQGTWEILVLGGDCLTAHDPETGAERWRWCGMNPQGRPNFRTVSTTVVGDDGMVFVTSPQHNPMHGLRIQGDRVETVWGLRRPTPDSTTPVHYRGRLYAVDGRNQRMVAIVPETGEVLWTGELETPSFIRASPTAADGKIYVVDAEGTCVVVAAADEFRVLGRMSFDSYPSRSTIVPTGSELLIRTAEALYCIGNANDPKASGK